MQSLSDKTHKRIEIIITILIIIIIQRLYAHAENHRQQLTQFK